MPPLDDESALAVTIVEHLLRLNLHPLEEAVDIQQVLDRGHDPKKLAARLRTSRRPLAAPRAMASMARMWAGTHRPGGDQRGEPNPGVLLG